MLCSHTLLLLTCAGLLAPAALFLAGQKGSEDHSLAENRYWPPWCAPPSNGLNFTIAMIDNAPDLHGDIVDPQLVVFFAGNQFMVVPDLLDAFRAEHPEIQRIFAETLPPGIEARQMEQGALIMGNLRIAVRPDVYTAGKQAIERLQKEKNWFDRTGDYAGNSLAIMVAAGNPKNIRSLADLGRPDVRVSMPDPKWEGVANRIAEAFHKAGGQELEARIMQAKVKDGATFLTHIHHRETPLRIILGTSDAGPVWLTEAKFQQAVNHPVALVEIPEKDNVHAVYTAATLRNAPHPAAAKAFYDFLLGAKARALYAKYHFEPPPAAP